MIKILIAGDYCPQERIAKMIEEEDYSFLNEVCDLTSKVDYSIVNLECPVTSEDYHNPIIKSGRNLKCTPRAIDAIKHAGFNCVTLANNHLNDFGEAAIIETLDVIKAKSLNYVGGGKTLKDSQMPLLLHISNKVVSIINVCEQEFSIASHYRAGAAPIDLIDIQRTIMSCKNKSDYILVIVHGGHEMYQLPSPMMQKAYRWFIDLGADTVINHHQHCYSGYELYQNKPIIYGLGNFCFDKPSQRHTIWNEGYMVELCLDDEILFKVIPYDQCNDKPEINLKSIEATENFHHSLKALCNIIDDPLLVEAEFERYCKNNLSNIIGLFSPYRNRYLRGAAKRGLLPSFLTKKKTTTLFDYINCDAHRNVVLKCLSDML